MTMMITGNVVDQRQLDHSSVVDFVSPIAVPSGNIALYVGTGLTNARQVEIVESWKYLMMGIRERNLLDVGNPFANATIYSVVNINNRGTSDRRTSSQFTELTALDIGIAIEATVSQEFNGYGLPLHASFLQLIEEAKADLLVAA